MPDAIITSTESTFGTISGTFAADQSTITGTVTGIVAGTLSGSVGVPGPAGPGVPAGGLEGQIIVKASETDYDTVWVDNAAETLTATVRNETGATLTKGTVVYINGASGNKATVTKASASTESGSSKTFAILKDDIPNNQNGTAVTVGLLKGVDTSAFSPGANLWLSTTAGQITQTMPTSPNHAVFLGNAVRIHANQGEIEVRIQNGLELGELHDVLIHDVANGQVLKYDSAQGLWVNGTDVGGVAWGGITGTLSDQTDLQTALDGKYSTSNPSGYITSSALTGYATESFVTSQGYITSAALSPYLLSSTAASTYAALAGATFTGVVGFNGASGNVAAKSTGHFKAYTSGAESTDYSLQYDTGFQVVVGGSTVARIAASGILAPSAGITFSDATTQTTAGVSAATVAATYAPLASPALTGNPTAPTPATADNDTSIATTAFVKAQGYLTSAPVTSVAGKTGAVTLVVGDVSGAAPLASPTFTGTPAAPTASAGTSTTQLATTAFVTTADNLKANLASPAFTGTPTAPTATAGTNTTQIATTAFVTAAVPAFATNTQARLGSSTTLGVNPNNLQAAIMSPNWMPVYRFGFTATVSGTGANCTLGNTNTFYQLPTLGAVSGHSYARTFGLTQVDQLTNLWGDDANIFLNFAKRIWISGRSLLTFPNEAVYTARVSFGKAEATGVGDLAARGIGWRYAGGASNFVQLMVHNGTTLTTVNSSFHPTNVAFDWDIVSAGDGNVTLFINGSQVATTANGPSTRATSGQCLYQEEIGLTATSTGNFLRFYCARGAIYVQP